MRCAEHHEPLLDARLGIAPPVDREAVVAESVFHARVEQCLPQARELHATMSRHWRRRVVSEDGTTILLGEGEQLMAQAIDVEQVQRARRRHYYRRWRVDLTDAQAQDEHRADQRDNGKNASSHRDVHRSRVQRRRRPQPLCLYPAGAVASPE